MWSIELMMGLVIILQKIFFSKQRQDADKLVSMHSPESVR